MTTTVRHARRASSSPQRALGGGAHAHAHVHGGFERCENCGTMHGPVSVCPACGWAVACAYCKVRVWIPGQGYTLGEAHSPLVSHRTCPWCSMMLWHADPYMVDVAALRLGVAPGYMEVHSRRMRDGRRWVTLSHDGRTGWAGAV